MINPSVKYISYFQVSIVAVKYISDFQVSVPAVTYISDFQVSVPAIKYISDLQVSVPAVKYISDFQVSVPAVKYISDFQVSVPAVKYISDLQVSVPAVKYISVCLYIYDSVSVYREILGSVSTNGNTFNSRILLFNFYCFEIYNTRGFKGSVNVPESCDFQSQFDLLNITFQPFFFQTFLPAYTF